MGRNSVHPSVHPYPPGASKPSERPSGPSEIPGGWGDERTNRISPHSTGLRPLPGPLPIKGKGNNLVVRVVVLGPYLTLVDSLNLHGQFTFHRTDENDVD